MAKQEFDRKRPRELGCFICSQEFLFKSILPKSRGVSICFISSPRFFGSEMENGGGKGDNWEDASCELKIDPNPSSSLPAEGKEGGI